MAEKDRKRLINRLESLIKSVEEGPQLAEQYGSVRYRPFFQTYNSCVKEFKYFCEQEYERLELEALPLYDDQGREQFTNRKISTLLHQSSEILAILNSLEPKVTPIWLIRNRDRIHWKRWLILFFAFVVVYLLGVNFGVPNWLKKIFEFIKYLINLF